MESSKSEKNPHWDEAYMRVLRWNKIFLASCVIGVCIDPLFLYIPITDENRKCIQMDLATTIVALILRSITDFFHIASMIFQLYLFVLWKVINPNWLPNFIKELREIASRISFHDRSTFKWHILVDILALLPFPQVIILFYFPKIAGSACESLRPRKYLNMLLLFQYIPRVFRVYLCGKQVSKTFDPLSELVYVRGAFNFVLYIIFAHIFGGLWYFYSMYRETACWHHVLQLPENKNLLNAMKSHKTTASLDCSDYANDRIWTHTHFSKNDINNITNVINHYCPVNDPNDNKHVDFDFGIYGEAIKARVLMASDFAHKFFHSFWWGLRNLCSFGGNLETSGDIEENIFAIFISIMGLLLFIYLIGNLQTYIQLQTKKSEKVRRIIKEKEAKIESCVSKIPNPKRTIFTTLFRRSIKEGNILQVDNVVSLLQRNPESGIDEAMEILEMDPEKQKEIPKEKELEAELWIENRKICDIGLKQKIMTHLRLNFSEYHDDFDVTNLLTIIPSNLATSLKEYLCFPILKKVPILKNIVEEGDKNIYKYLQPIVYPENSYIIRKGEPIDLMILITHGSLWTFTSSTLHRLDNGDYYGNELLQWLLEKKKREFSVSPNLLPQSNWPDFPISDRDVKSYKKVEGYVLKLDDLERLMSSIGTEHKF